MCPPENYEEIDRFYWRAGGLDIEDLMARHGSWGKTEKKGFVTGFVYYEDLLVPGDQVERVWPRAT